MKSKSTNEQRAIELVGKIDQKKKELKILNKQYKDALNAISISWKVDVRKQFPQLVPCNIGELVGVDITIGDKVYNIFISDQRQKLLCMFSLDRKNKNNSDLYFREVISTDDFETLKQVLNCHLKANKTVAYESTQGFYLYFKMEQINAAYDLFQKVVKAFVHF